MAKTTNNNIFVITPRTAKRAITLRNNKKRPPAWYFGGLLRKQLESLAAEPGVVESFITSSGRTVFVASVDDVSPGTAYELTMPLSGVKEAVIVNPDAL